MSHLYAMRSSALMLICVLFYLLSAGQTIHACFTTMQRGAALRRLGIAYEVALVVHLVLACAVANSAMENQGVFILWLHPVVLPVVPLLWANAVAAVMGGIRAVRLHRWSALAEVALLACCTPVAIGAMGQGSQALLAVDASYFAARVAATLAFDLHDSKTSVSRLSIVDALDALPEGVMWVSERGEVLFMNDAMRGSLISLGLATDLADARGLWGRLESHARQAAHDRLIIETDPPDGPTLCSRRGGAAQQALQAHHGARRDRGGNAQRAPRERQQAARGGQRGAESLDAAGEEGCRGRGRHADEDSRARYRGFAPLDSPPLPRGWTRGPADAREGHRAALEHCG